MAYHVKRAEFDELLLDHARESGAEVQRRTPVAGVLFEEGAARSASVPVPTAAPSEVTREVVVDASGQDAMLSRTLGTRRFDSKLKRAALFAHYEGIRWPEGHQAGDILLPIDVASGTGSSPFPTGPASVGAVFEPALTRA